MRTENEVRELLNYLESILPIVKDQHDLFVKAIEDQNSYAMCEVNLITIPGFVENGPIAIVMNKISTEISLLMWILE